MSRTAWTCESASCGDAHGRTRLGTVVAAGYSRRLDLLPGVRCRAVLGGVEVICPRCGRARRWRGKAVQPVTPC